MSRIDELDREMYRLEMEILDIKSEVEKQAQHYKATLLEARDSEFKAIREQRKLLAAERQALIDARDGEEIARASKDERVGKIYCKWGRQSYSRYWSSIKHRGIVEVLTPQLQRFGQKMGIYSAPEIGSLVYRYLKADGTVGKRYEPWDETGYNGWFPEGVDPRKKVGE